MAAAAGGVSLFGSSATVSLRTVPPPFWVLVALILGVFVIAWHGYRSTPDDVSWTDPQQPPDNLPVGTVVPPAVAGATWGTPAMRGRRPYRFKFWPAADHCAGAWSLLPTSGRPEAATWGGTV